MQIVALLQNVAGLICSRCENIPSAIIPQVLVDDNYGLWTKLHWGGPVKVNQSSLQEISLKKMLKQFYFTEQFYNRQVINLNLRGIFYSAVYFSYKALT